MDAFLAAAKVTPTGDPVSYDDAMQTNKAPLWHESMKEEI